MTDTATREPRSFAVYIPTLYHFTCDHDHRIIASQPRRRGGPATLHPLLALTPTAEKPHVPWTGLFVWLTDMSGPLGDLAQWGLLLDQPHGHHQGPCDRTAHRYHVAVDDEPPPVLSWPRAVRALDLGKVRHELETRQRAMPAHWWVATAPVRAMYDPLP